MKLDLLFLGKTKEVFLADGISLYSSRLAHYVPVSVRTLKAKGKAPGDDAAVRQAEGRLLLEHVPAGAFKVVLDPRGRQFTSEEAAELVTRWEMQGIKQVCFLIGGASGLSEEVVQAADLLLSLSRMTFTHDMTRLFLLEQLYRAYTIKAGEKYHK